MLRKFLIASPVLFNGLFLALVYWNNWRLEYGIVDSIRYTAPFELLLFCCVSLVGIVGVVLFFYHLRRDRKLALSILGSLIIGLILFFITFALGPSMIYVT